MDEQTLKMLADALDRAVEKLRILVASVKGQITELELIEFTMTGMILDEGALLRDKTC